MSASVSAVVRGYSLLALRVSTIAPVSARLFVPYARNVFWKASPSLCQVSVPVRGYSAQSRHLEDCLKKELKLERMTMDEVPIVSGFEVAYTGSQATLSRRYNDEIIEVEIDANHAVEVVADEDEEEEPFFVPAFTVTIIKPSGSLQLECSFDEEGSYHEQGNEWDNLRVDSMCVMPTKSSDSAAYTADTQFLSEELVESVKRYLQQRGINQQFTSEVIAFYQSFEHHNYVNNFLDNLQKFLIK